MGAGKDSRQDQTLIARIPRDPHQPQHAAHVAPFDLLPQRKLLDRPAGTTVEHPLPAERPCAPPVDHCSDGFPTA
jgi:hypothetical protein